MYRGMLIKVLSTDFSTSSLSLSGPAVKLVPTPKSFPLGEVQTSYSRVDPNVKSDRMTFGTHPLPGN